jgi:hypothetical protein
MTTRDTLPSRTWNRSAALDCIRPSSSPLLASHDVVGEHEDSLSVKLAVLVRLDAPVVLQRDP